MLDIADIIRKGGGKTLEFKETLPSGEILRRTAVTFSIWRAAKSLSALKADPVNWSASAKTMSLIVNGIQGLLLSLHCLYFILGNLGYLHINTQWLLKMVLRNPHRWSLAMACIRILSFSNSRWIFLAPIDRAFSRISEIFFAKIFSPAYLRT